MRKEGKELEMFYLERCSLSVHRRRMTRFSPIGLLCILSGLAQWKKEVTCLRTRISWDKPFPTGYPFLMPALCSWF